jgi:TldD protein
VRAISGTLISTLIKPKLNLMSPVFLRHRNRGAEVGTQVFTRYHILFPAGNGALFVHEVIGHLLEANSAGCCLGALGDRIAPEHVTIVDDPRLAGGFGSYRFDDEGHPAEESVLVCDGKLNGFLTDRLTSEALQLPRTGNGRREGVNHDAAPRMSNTFLVSTNLRPAAELRERAGIFVERMGVGRVNKRNGEYLLEVRDAWLCGGGSTRLLAPFYIRGRASDFLRGIAAASGSIRHFPSYCFGPSGIVPVSYGQPEVLVTGLCCMPKQRQETIT